MQDNDGMDLISFTSQVVVKPFMETLNNIIKAAKAKIKKCYNTIIFLIIKGL